MKSVRFERISQDDTKLKTKAVARMIPKIMKRKWRGGDYLGRPDHEGLWRTSGDSLSDSHIEEHGGSGPDNNNEQELQ